MTEGPSKRASCVEPREFWIQGEVPLRVLCWGKGAVEGADGGPALVLLHGIGDGADIWRPMVAAWPNALYSPVFAVDLPGHGGSGRLSPEDYTVDRLARIVEAAVASLGLNSPIIAGHSLGARVALGLGSSPRTPSLLVLVEPSLSGSPAVNGAIADHISTLRAGAPTRTGLLDLIGSRMPLADPEAIALAVPALVAAGAGNTRLAETGPKTYALTLDPAIAGLLSDAPARDAWNQLTEARVPIAIVRGAFSSALSLQELHAMARTVRQCAGFKVLKACGHAVPLEAPRALAETLYDWAISL